MSESAGFGRWSGNVITYSYDAGGELLSVSEPSPPGSSCEHDEKKRVFRITEPNGRMTEFHDRAVRFLVVEPDPETGEAKPIVWAGRTRVVYLCREAGL